MTDNTNSSITGFSRVSRPPNLTIKKIKTEDSPSRLPSLRGPRDLTLGGIKKKTFAPNIPVRKNRIKVETKDEKSAAKPRNEKRFRSSDSRGRGRGRGRGSRSQVIQQHSIFEAGPGLSSSGRGDSLRAVQTSSSAQIQKPTIKKEKLDYEKEKSESDEVLRRLEGGNNSIISDLHNDENLAPMILPLSDQPDGSGDGVAAVFRDGQQKLILLQIPDSLPGVYVDEEDEAETKNVKRETHAKESTASSRAGIDRLADGFVGKLQMLKSGRCRLLLGGLSFAVKMGTTPTFAQEIVSVRVSQDGDAESKGHLSVLDEVSSKLVCVPDVSSLIRLT